MRVPRDAGADDDGGALFNDDTIGSIDDCTFLTNHAEGDGGALWNSDTVTVVRMSRFIGNYVDGDGEPS